MNYHSVELHQAQLVGRLQEAEAHRRTTTGRRSRRHRSRLAEALRIRRALARVTTGVAAS